MNKRKRSPELKSKPGKASRVAQSQPGAWASLLVLGLLLSGCAPAPQQEGLPRVVASFFPVYDFAREVAGPDFEVVCLVPPGGDPHSADVTPEMARQVTRADLVLLLGLDMDGWVSKLAATERPTRQVVVTRGLPSRPPDPTELHEFAADDHHHHDDVDPHVWLDPELAQRMVQTIAEALIELRPDREEALRERRDAYVAQLSELDEAFRTGLAEVPRRPLVTFHGAFGYLFARYGLEVAAAVEVFPGDEPSAAYLRALVDLMRQRNIDVIFAEPQLPDRAAQVIAREIGGRVERLDPCETLLVEEPKATYLDRQRRNLATLVRVLGAEAP
jgi:zinc transport system substrate-binding protein